MLSTPGIKHVRIDGDIPPNERPRIIKQFQEDDATSLLLMTTGTGAVGYETDTSSPLNYVRSNTRYRLNLTAATRVHLVEPQWNPAIEAQAIGRALRLGQTRSVTVIRYVVQNSIEEVNICYDDREKTNDNF